MGIAHREGNNKSVELLLKYISKKQHTSHKQYIELFPQLLQYKTFMNYLRSIPIMTFQMERKQILQVDGSNLNDQIVRITDNHTSYIDEDFFMNKMGDNPT